MTEARQVNNHAGLIWSIADLLRGDYKQSEYGRVILPLVVLRRLDCVLEPTKQQVLDRLAALEGRIANVGPILEPITGLPDVYNTSRLTLRSILADPAQVAGNLRAWIAAFDEETRDVIEKFDFDAQVGRLDRAKLLYLVLSKVTEVDLHPDAVSNIEMGYLYEELVRKFSELSNETAGEHFTPREVIRLMVDLLFVEDDDALRTPGIVRTMLDPACGTGGMLSTASDYLRELNPGARLEGYGQELNAETYAICRSDMMLKGQKASNVRLGNSFSEDAFKGAHYDYLLANPPFGVEWKKVQREVEDEREKLGFGGRFGAGLPRINDGSFLFLQHMISKLKRPEEGGGRLAIVFNGSPLFTGGAGSGESEIRRWIIENDWLEGIVALPDQLFYNTGISTYFWIVTNRKGPEHRGVVQLVDARELFVKMRKSLGEKRKEISPDQIAEITRLYGAFKDGERVKILPNESFGFQRITLERPLRLRWEVTKATLPSIEASLGWAKLTDPDRQAFVDRLARLQGFASTDRLAVPRRLGPLPKAIEKAVWDALSVRDPEAPVITDRKGHPEPDPNLRDSTDVPFPSSVEEYKADPSDRLTTEPYRVAVDDYMTAEVLPYVPDAWVDHAKTKLGYEIPVTRHFYSFVRDRPLEVIDAEITLLDETIRRYEQIQSDALSGIAGWPVGGPRKASSTEWLTDIPAHWDEVKLTLLAELGSGHTPSREHPEWWVDCTIPWITTGEVWQLRDDRVEYIQETRERISVLGLANSAAELHPAGTVVLSRTASAGFSAIMATDMATSQDFVTWTCGPLLRPRFLLLCLRAMRSDLLGRLAMGSTHKTIYFPDIQSIRVPLPPLDEQDFLVEWVWQRLREIDEVVDAVRRRTELLGERRHALTSAGVRGHIPQKTVLT